VDTTTGMYRRTLGAWNRWGGRSEEIFVLLLVGGRAGEIMKLAYWHSPGL
jgi:hypothetical protein